MPKKQLLLPGAKSAVLIGGPHKPLSPWWHRGAVAFGVLAVIIGAVDVANRVAQAADALLGDQLTFTAFAPGALALNPELRTVLQGTSTAPFVPAKILVSSIGVDAVVEPVGNTAEGAMAAPKALQQVGWYELGSKPGGAGNAVFAGHVNNALGLPGVFKKLHQVKVGDEVRVVGARGETLVYTVESLTVYKEDKAPLEEIFASFGPSRLVLVTCEGDWDEASRSYDKRLVVVAKR